VRAAALLVLAGAGWMAEPRAVSAGDATADISLEYGLLHDSDLEYTFGGPSVEAACRVYGWVYVSGEAAFSHHHQDYSSTQGGTYKMWYESFQGGPRLSPLQGRVQPYAEVLVGATRLGIWETQLDHSGEWGSWDLSLQPAVGVDVGLSRRFALRVSGDLRVLFRTDNRFDVGYRTKLYQVSAGIVLRLGGA